MMDIFNLPLSDNVAIALDYSFGVSVDLLFLCSEGLLGPTLACLIPIIDDAI